MHTKPLICVNKPITLCLYRLPGTNPHQLRKMMLLTLNLFDCSDKTFCAKVKLQFEINDHRLLDKNRVKLGIGIKNIIALKD